MVKVKEKVKEFSLLVSSVSSSSLSKRRAVVTHLHIIRTSLIEPELGLASFQFFILSQLLLTQNSLDTPYHLFNYSCPPFQHFLLYLARFLDT